MSQSNYFLGNSGKLIKFDAHKTPEFAVKNNIDWAIYGTDKDWYNQHPDYLIHLYNSSPKNNAIINEKCSYIEGQGLTYSSVGIGTGDKLLLSSYISKFKDSKVFQRSIKDVVIQGGFANEMIYNKGLDKVEPFHIDFSHIRVSKPEYDDQGRLKDPVYYYTSDWSKRNPTKNSQHISDPIKIHSKICSLPNTTSNHTIT